MRTLYHLPLSPFSRKVRIALAEKKLDFQLVVEKTWERRVEFLHLNPAGEVPVLVEEDGRAIPDSQAICEYIEDMQIEPPLIGLDPHARAEVRRLTAFFDLKFNREVTKMLVGEKLYKRFLSLGEPDSRCIRAGYANIKPHLDYISWLAEHRTWLAGDTLSLADIAAAAQLSCVDYIGDVPWEEYPAAKDWYARIKSRPSFRPLLSDNVPGCPPPRHYADLDF